MASTIPQQSLYTQRPGFCEAISNGQSHTLFVIQKHHSHLTVSMGCTCWEYSWCHRESLDKEVDLCDPNRQRKYFLELSNGRGRDFDLLQLFPPLSLNWNPSNPPRDSVLYWTYKYELHIIPLFQRSYQHEINHDSNIHILSPLCNTTPHITIPTLFVARSNSKRIPIRRPLATESSTLNFQHNQGRNPLSVFKCPHIRITIFWTRKKTIVLRIPIQSSDG